MKKQRTVIGNNINEILAERGIKKTWLAQKLGISSQAMNDLLTRDIRLSTAMRVAKALDLSLDELAEKR